MPTTPFDDVLNGDEFDNILNGEDGLDVLSGLGGNDTMNGGDDEDELFGGDGNDTLSGGEDDDALFGEDGNDLLNGDEGEDDLRGGDGDDTLNGGDGDDMLRGDDGDDMLNGGNGDDRLIGGEGADILNGGSGFDTASYITSSEGIDVSMGASFDENAPRSEGDGDELISIEQVLGSDHDDTIRDIDFGDSVLGRGGDDTFVVVGRAAEINGGSGYDRLVVEGFFGFGGGEDGDDFTVENPVTNVEELVLSGEFADVVMTLEQFLAFERVVFDETATSSSALNIFIGDVAAFDISQINALIDFEGDASVVLVGDDTDQVFAGSALAEGFDAGDGDDRVDAGAGDDELRGGNGNDDLRGDDGNDRLFGGSDDDSLRGGTGDDTLFGGNGNDLLLGGRGDDQLNGGFGDDVLDGGSGADAIDGEFGFDTVTYANSNEGIRVHLSNAQFDGQGGDAEGDTLLDIESIIGSNFDDIILGAGEGDVIDAGSGDDTIETNGAEGQTIDGGAGTDRLIVTGPSDLRDRTLSGIEELEIQTTDGGSTFVEVSFDQFDAELIAFSNVEAAVFQTAVLTQDGQDFSFDFDTTGSTSAILTVFSDPAGGDTGFDLDSTNEFFEVIVDGVSLGTFSANAVGDQIDLGTTSNSTEFAFDTGGLALSAAEFEALFADGNVTIEVNFSNAVNPFSGPDTLFVSLAVDNPVVQPPGEATLRLHAGSETERDLSDLTLEGFDGDLHTIQLVGDNDDERFTGSERDDFIVGNRGSDLLRGEDGDDTLIGGEDDDRLIGGEGADTLDGGAGFDTVSYIGSDAGIEVDLTDPDNSGLGGEAEGDQLTNVEHVLGSNFDDVFTLGDNNGAHGRGGNDTFIVDADNFEPGGTPLTFNGGSGTDRLVVTSDTNFSGDDISSIEELELVGGDIVFTSEQLLGFDRITASGDAVLAVAVGEAETFDFSQLTIEGDGNVVFALAGEDGNDTILLDGSGATLATGLGGDDTIIGTDEGDILSGNDGDDDLHGAGGLDILFGETGNDTLRGGDGDDQLNAGEGDDLLIGDAGTDVLSGDNGNDRLIGGEGDDSLFGDAGDDRLIGGEGADDLDGGEGIDTASYISSDSGIEIDLSESTFIGIGGEAEGDTLEDIESVLGSNFDDTIRGVNDASVSVNTRGGDDTIFIENAGNPGVVINGGAGTDRLVVTDRDVVSLDFTGIEILDFSAVDGNPIVDAADLADLSQIITHGGDLIVSYDGTFDLADFLANLDVDLVGNPRLVFHGRENDDTAFGSDQSDFINGNEGADDLRGGNADDLLRGNQGNDTLRGEDGVDQLFGGDDDDRLIGGAGADDLDGGAGVDTASYIGSDAGIEIDLSDDAFIGIGGEAEGDRLQSIESVLGSNFGDTVRGVDATSVEINTRGGDDTIFLEETESQSINGGAGTDTLVVTGSGDLRALDLTNVEVLDLSNATGQIFVTEAQLGGVTQIILEPTNPSFFGVEVEGAFDLEDLFAGIEIIGAAPELFVAPTNQEVDRITGFGTDQADGFSGSNNADNLRGRGGDDRFEGFGGDDDLRGDDGNDVINGGSGNDSLRGDGGDDTLNGNADDDRLIGGAGADAMDGGDGFDTVSYISSAEGVQVALDGSAAGTGGEAEGDTLTAIEGFLGSNFADTLTGLSDGTVVNTRGGDDVIELDFGLTSGTIDGGTGTDTLVIGGALTVPDANVVLDRIERVEIVASAAIDVGQLGFDTLVFQDGSDLFGVVADSANSIDISDLAVEGFVEGETEIRLAGRDTDDFLIGNNLANTLLGSGGNDDLRGNDGDDELSGGDGDDTMRGGLGDDTLSGDAGDDRLIGGRGSDMLTGGTGDDVFVFANSQSGNDVVTDLESTDLVEISGLVDFDAQAFLDDLLAQQAADPGDDVVITLDNGTITLSDVDFALTQDNFVFV